MIVGKVGYGAGDDRPAPVPNVLRVSLGETTTKFPGGDRVVVLETSIDDMNPEWFGHLSERLFAAGALDVSYTATVMKKGRPGQDVRVITPLASEESVTRTLFRESTTFGLRRSETERVILARERREVQTPWGPVHVKVGKLDGKVMTCSPEHDDLQRAAAKAALPLKEVYRQVLELFGAAESEE